MGADNKGMLFLVDYTNGLYQQTDQVVGRYLSHRYIICLLLSNFGKAPAVDQDLVCTTWQSEAKYQSHKTHGIV